MRCKEALAWPSEGSSDVPLTYLHSFLSAFLFFIFCLFRATPEAYGGSQARGQIGAVAASLHHSHSNTGSELYLQPTPQLVATLDP